jgi:type I restriction enzyme S subunit
LKNFTIVVPPLETQHEIVSLLEKAEETKRLRAQADELTQKLIQSVFLEMFGDPLNNSKGWKETDLEYVLAESPQNGLYKPSSDYGSGTPILRIDSFYDGSIADTTYLKRLRCKPAEVKKYQLNIGEILINRVNSLEYLGKCGLVETLYEDTVFESNMMRLKLNHSIINPKYLVYLLCTKYIKNQLNQKAKKAVNQASINQKDVKSLKIKTPPIELQNQFAKLVNQIEKTKQLQQQSSNEMDTLFDSLMQKVFIGELVH